MKRKELFYVDRTIDDISAERIAERSKDANRFDHTQRIGGWIKWKLEDEVFPPSPDFLPILIEAKRQYALRGKDVWIYLMWDSAEKHFTSATRTYEGEEITSHNYSYKT